MNLLDRIKHLCKINNISIARLEQETGLANGSIRKWEKAPPSADRLGKVADYFVVSTDYLLGRTNNPDDIFIEYDAIPDVMKPFIKHDTKIIASIDIKNGSGTIAERKAAVEEVLKSTSVLYHSSELKELLDLLPEDKKNTNLSLYDLFYTISNDKKAMLKLQEEPATYTVAASRKDGYEEPLTEDESAAVKAFLETYRKMKQK